MDTTRFHITQTWDGLALAPDYEIHGEISSSPEGLHLTFVAPLFDYQSPKSPPGRCDNLWEFDVVEFFFLGDQEKYLEMEFGPQGHFLVLQLEGVRTPIDTSLHVDYTAKTTDQGQWVGEALVPSSLLPEGLHRWNAFAIWGKPPGRTHAALSRGEGPPNFHQLSSRPTRIHIHQCQAISNICNTQHFRH